MSIALPVIILNLCVVISRPVLIGVYVYRDALDRGMNAVGWTAVAVLAPAFTGLIIYLLVRSGNVPLKCPGCNARVRESFVLCPCCGAKLRYTCSGCGRPVEAEWKLCPNCGRPVEREPGVTPPVYRTSNALKYVLVAVGAALVLTFAVSLISFTRVGSSQMGMVFAPASDYEDYSEVSMWLSGEGESRVYALKSVKEADGSVTTRYLVVCPEIARKSPPEVVSSESGAEAASGLFSTDIKVNINTETDYGVWYIEYTGDREAGLKVIIDGDKTDCEIITTDFIKQPGE